MHPARLAAALALATAALPALASGHPASTEAPGSPHPANAPGRLPHAYPAYPAAAENTGSFSALPALLEEARALLPRQPEAAWQLLEPHTWTYAGSRDFDYLLAVAALDSHRPSEAIMALERVLDHHPDDTEARTELARAHLALNEHDSARQVLQQLVQQPALPLDARESVQRYLDIIARQGSDAPRRWQLGLSLNAGHDSNVNAGSTRNRWIIDDGQVLTPLTENQPQSSPFAELGLQFQHTLPLSGTLAWTNGLHGSHRVNTRQHRQDSGTLGASSGLAFTQGAHRLSVALNLQQMWLHHRRFRRATGVLGQWQFDPDAQNQLGLYLQHFALDFHEQPQRDARRALLGATWAHGFRAPGNPVLITNPYAGRERPRHALPVLDFRIAGLRLGLQQDIGAGWRGHLGLQWEERRHRGTDPLFGRTRHDRQLDVRLGADWALSPQLTLSPQLLHTRNHATLAPNDFRRTQVLVDVQYRW